MDSTLIGTNTTNAKILHLNLTTVGTKTPDPNPLTRPIEFSKCKEQWGKSTYQRTWSQTHYRQTPHQENLIRLVIANTENLKSKENLMRPVTANTENLKQEMR